MIQSNLWINYAGVILERSFSILINRVIDVCNIIIHRLINHRNKLNYKRKGRETVPAFPRKHYKTRRDLLK